MTTPAKPSHYILKPSAGRITIRLEDVERSTKSGLYLVGDSHVQKPVTGYVEETCDEYDLDGEPYEPLYKKGDLVIFGKFTGSKVKVGDQNFMIIREADILGRLVPSDEAAERPAVSIASAAINDGGAEPDLMDEL